MKLLTHDWSKICALVLLILQCLACQEPSSSMSESTTLKTAGDLGARKLLQAFLPSVANTRALTAELTPRADDFQLVFVGDAATKAWAAYLPLFRRGESFEIKPERDQSELFLWSATTHELRTGAGNARKFPSEYKNIAPYLKPGLKWYRFEFVRPGDSVGTSGDGLVFVKDHWVLFAKPWRIVE